MKKIILGSVLVTIIPFLSILGYMAVAYFNIPEGPKAFAGALGGAGIIFNFVVGIALMIKGHQESETFKGWGA